MTRAAKVPSAIARRLFAAHNLRLASGSAAALLASSPRSGRT